MADLHLPDCYYGEKVRDNAYVLDCICDRLRACRERTLDEAREAINQMPGESGCSALGLWEDGSHALIRHIDQGRAIAAIDGLRAPQS